MRVLKTIQLPLRISDARQTPGSTVLLITGPVRTLRNAMQTPVQQIRKAVTILTPQQTPPVLSAIVTRATAGLCAK